MTPRLRRLRADEEQVVTRFEGHSHVRVVETWGRPPDRYLFEFRVPGLVPVDRDGATTSGDTHRAEVFLGADYPRRPPFCRMVTPVFHPNIDPQKICIGDHWSAGESLVDLVSRIAEMICFQSYNVKSPLNAEAAVWVIEHELELPLLRADLAPGRR